MRGLVLGSVLLAGTLVLAAAQNRIDVVTPAAPELAAYRPA